MTVNQALDKLLTQYAGKDLKNFPDVFALKCNLIELKVNWGGNHKLENPTHVNRIIKNGKK
jgi:hypothetical protein